ncbi:MAG: GAF domain-containing protein [Anaerolineae bacterium]|nr:GAF domain-containing protein [Anaerolineae bacterium]
MKEKPHLGRSHRPNIAVDQSLDLQGMLAAALDTILKALGCKAGGIGLWDEKTQRISLTASRGAEQELREILQPEGRWGEVLHTGQPIFYDVMSP